VKAVRAAAKRSKDGPQARRLLALASIYDGATRSEAAKIGGVTLQVVRDWALRLNAQGPDGLIDRKAPGQPPRLNDEHRAALAAILESGPIPAVHGVARWRIVDLCQWIRDELRVVVSQQTLSRVLRAMGYRKLAARPAIMPMPRQQSRILKKVSPRAFKRSGGRRPSIRRHRSLVRRRGARRPEEQDHPPFGQAWNAPERANRSENRVGLYLRRDLPP
jgi:transposase